MKNIMKELTWGEIKREAEKNGIKDDSLIYRVSILNEDANEISAYEVDDDGILKWEIMTG